MMKFLAALAAAFVFLAHCATKQDMTVREGTLHTSDGVGLFYRSVGNGRSVVLIPNGLYYFDALKHLADSHKLIFYDVRNRGRSESVTDASKLESGIQNDVNDLETVRKHFGLEQVSIIGHSYIGLMIGLYAIQHPDAVHRMVQISPAPPDSSKQYPPHLAYVDDVITRVMSDLAKLQAAPRPEDPVESCKQFWSVLGPINVFNPNHASKIDWGRCELPNERNFMEYWSKFVFPSIQKIRVTEADGSKLQAPVLVIHGDKDRSAAYGGGRDWAAIWANARLLTLKDVAHAPWIEDPKIFEEAISAFLNGDWPKQVRGAYVSRH